jgi:hypothetical protein
MAVPVAGGNSSSLTHWPTSTLLINSQLARMRSKSANFILSSISTVQIVHPFQMRENSRERMSIDTREHLLNMTPAAHFRQANFVIRSSVLVHQRLRLALNLNENLLSERGRLREVNNGAGRGKVNI